MIRHDAKLAAQLYSAPARSLLVGDVLTMGEGINAACAALARNPCTVEADALLAQLQAAHHSITRMRAALVAEAAA